MENSGFIDQKILQVYHSDKDRDKDYDDYNIPNTSNKMKQRLHCLVPQLNKQHQLSIKDKN